MLAVNISLLFNALNTSFYFLHYWEILDEEWWPVQQTRIQKSIKILKTLGLCFWKCGIFYFLQYVPQKLEMDFILFKTTIVLSKTEIKQNKNFITLKPKNSSVSMYSGAKELLTYDDSRSNLSNEKNICWDICRVKWRIVGLVAQYLRICSNFPLLRVQKIGWN